MTSTPLAGLQEAQAAFEQQYPTFATTRVLDELRATDYARLDAQEHVYLDYTGGGLYAERQLRDYMALLSNQVFGNPHSTNPASRAMTILVERARRAVLDYFRASPDEYVVIFTPNATGALKLVGEAYPFTAESQYLLTFDNHNSVNGIREFAQARGARVTYLPVEPPDLRVNEEQLLSKLAQGVQGQPNLFAYPAQSNVSGVQHPLEWIAQAQASGWDVLVDCAAFVPSNRLDLTRWHPDFVPLSFYKMFGFPTGAGCLLARKSALHKLRRPWFAGGTITFASVIAADTTGLGFYLSPGEAGFEDGTINYLLLPAVEIGLHYIESIGIEVIHERIRCLTAWVLENLLAIRHSNAQPVVRIYGPITTERRGGTIAFNFYDPDGVVLDCYALQEEANQCHFSVRSGCFCNPGVREVALGLVRENLAASFRNKERMTYEQFLEVIDDQKQGALRVSFGLATTFEDVYRFIQFVRTFIDRRASSVEVSNGTAVNIDGGTGTMQEQETHGAETTVGGQGGKRLVVRVCACGYQDNRLDKRFCPYCGRPLPTTASTLATIPSPCSPADDATSQQAE
jgi:selenocysteine lyase/cysteine desulfurase